MTTETNTAAIEADFINAEAEAKADAHHALLLAQLLAARAAYNDAKFNGSSEQCGRALTALGLAREAYSNFGY